MRGHFREDVVLVLGQVQPDSLQVLDIWWKGEDQRITFLFSPSVEIAVRFGCRVLDNRVLPGTINAANLMRQIDLCFAVLLF